MSKEAFVPLDREEFRLLREAKRLISKEFDQELKLQDSDVLKNLYGFALRSEAEELFDIFEQLNASREHAIGHRSRQSQSEKQPEAEVKIGDLVNGKRCTGFYRGQPIFK